MSENAFKDLSALGVAISYDNIGRDLIQSGELERLVREDAVVGVTANPIIFQTAVSSTDTYDAEILELHAAGVPPDRIVMEAWAHDIQMAADILRPVYESTHGHDGYVSFELPPRVAHDAEGTLLAAREWHKQVDRPNLCLKIPATQESFGVIEQCLTEGINVNVTVIFAPDTYESVVRAYTRALENRLSQGRSLDVMSFASIFISRFDAPVDQALIERIRRTAESSQVAILKSLLGRAAIANAWRINRRFRSFFDGREFDELRKAGGQPQRPLWAGLVTRNPRYGDVNYVEALSIPGTVMTMSDPPFRAFKAHGVPLAAMDDGSQDEILATLDHVGVDLIHIAHEMEEQVVTAFTDAFDQLVSQIEGKTRTERGDDLVVHR